MILWSMHSHASIKPSFTLLLYWIAVFYSLPKCFLLILHGGNRKKKRQAKLCYCGKSISTRRNANTSFADFIIVFLSEHRCHVYPCHLSCCLQLMQLVSCSLPSFLPPATPRSSPAPSCLIESGFLCHGGRCASRLSCLGCSTSPGLTLVRDKDVRRGGQDRWWEGAEWSVA